MRAMTDHSSLLVRVVRGAVAGGVATWFMDLATTGFMANQTPHEAAREKAAQPNGKSSVMNMLDTATAVTGIRLDDEAKSIAANLTHYALGVVPGALYAAVRPYLPPIRAGHGLVYGLTLFVVNDEFLNSAMGFAGPPDAYPVSSHVRGLVGHVVLGITTDAGIDILGG